MMPAKLLIWNSPLCRLVVLTWYCLITLKSKLFIWDMIIFEFSTQISFIVTSNSVESGLRTVNKHFSSSIFAADKAMFFAVVVLFMTSSWLTSWYLQSPFEAKLIWIRWWIKNLSKILREKWRRRKKKFLCWRPYSFTQQNEQRNHFDYLATSAKLSGYLSHVW